MRKTQNGKAKKDPLTRAIEARIEARKRALVSADKRIARIRANAEEEVARIEKQKAKSRVLLDALERGSLKP